MAPWKSSREYKSFPRSLFWSPYRTLSSGLSVFRSGPASTERTSTSYVMEAFGGIGGFVSFLEKQIQFIPGALIDTLLEFGCSIFLNRSN